MNHTTKSMSTLFSKHVQALSMRSHTHHTTKSTLNTSTHLTKLQQPSPACNIRQVAHQVHVLGDIGLHVGEVHVLGYKAPHIIKGLNLSL